MQPSPRAPSLKGQILTCLLFVIAAVAITSILHPSPRFSEWRTGKPIEMQLLLAAAFAAISAVGVAIMLSISALTKLIQVPSAIRAFDLSGTTPWIVGLCAGIGEELLFRAALQPLVGLWIGALIFASAHARTAIIGTPSNAKRVGYLLNVFIAGVALGLVFEHFGLLAAVLMHATIDVAGLLVCRNLAARRVVPIAV